MSSPSAVLARSLLFNALFYINMIVRMIVALPAIMLPHAFLLGILRGYARSSLWLLRAICGVKVEWRGREKLPPGACLVACKHQSLWETFALFALLPDPAYILKRELMWIHVRLACAQSRNDSGRSPRARERTRANDGRDA